MNYTKRQAIADVRSCANAVIEQLERWDKGWDQGLMRDDDPECAGFSTARQRMRTNVSAAFRISQEFAK